MTYNLNIWAWILGGVIFIMIFIPILAAGLNPEIQQEIGDPLDERMRNLKGLAYRRAFKAMLVFILLLAFVDGMWCEYKEMPSFASPAVFLYWVAAFGFAVLMADCRIKGIDIGKKGNEKSARHIIWIWIAILLLPVVQFIEDGFFFHVSFPLKYAEGMVFGNMFVAVSMVIAHIIRIRNVKKEELEDRSEEG